MKIIQFPRTLAVVDIENLCGGATEVPFRQSLVRDSFLRYQRGPVMPVLALGSLAVHLCPDLLWDWLPARQIIRPGINGADLALVQVLEQEPLVKRVDRVQIWSGDGCFSEAALRLRKAGIDVEVVAVEGAISRLLSSAANRITRLAFSSEVFGESERMELAS